MPSQLNAVRGFRDLLPSEAEPFAALESLARARLSRYGFREIRLPTLEHKDLFVKTTGETTDIVEKEMFQLEDQGGRTLALRPEGTPGAVRAFLNHHLSQEGGITKLFYIGGMFRAERPQAGRYREFSQIGAEGLGNPHPAADVEAILALKAIFDGVGLEGKTRLQLNNIGCDEYPECRPRFREALRSHLRSHLSELCVHCQKRVERNPLRALDCKADGPKLGQSAPRLVPCAACSAHVAFVSEGLKRNGCTFELDANLVRGLDYYTRTVFEVRASGLGAQDAIAGGGRYDGLVASMGGPNTPAVGWALGVERTLLALSSKSAGRLTETSGGMDAFVAVQTENPQTSLEGLRLLESLRRRGLRAEGGMFASSLKAQLREAGRKKARLAIILGEAELKKTPPLCILKDMADSQQREIELASAAEVLAASLGESSRLIS